MTAYNIELNKMLERLNVHEKTAGINRQESPKNFDDWKSQNVRQGFSMLDQRNRDSVTSETSIRRVEYDVAGDGI